ncbi:uncharacterized protein PADG_12436 [Paracoccidioides brasiliensis Pb18]|uniref:Uncharacterized protein n=1 Tax=Paracoccidioides brasiliensis (strain Pb18) TaxID=502780 RepID=A0A0A0HTZ2_PARBD|nr:uncharacterized protein PADG_12436 [Paracoccidioides brasiliensis Pb18]KGM91481.1 hypothetical protein PADG_12436 [Paracoccidioides brasiliensis Pb18]
MALATKTNVFEIHTKTLVKDRMHEKLLKWLFPLNSSWRPECQKKRVDGTNLKYLDRSSETATCRTLSTMEIQEQGNDSLVGYRSRKTGMRSSPWERSARLLVTSAHFTAIYICLDAIDELKDMRRLFGMLAKKSSPMPLRQSAFILERHLPFHLPPEQTVLDREEALKPLPSNLDDAFAGTMERIERQTDSQFKLEAEAID